ncbi:MAG: site-2 protease family protein [Enterobacterales bacterium]|nr:site-2 protease family protein [Enterobacterales bacterium]
MIQYLLNGQYQIFILLLIAIIISLSFHEFGHAWTAKKFGDNTAERMGRLTLNPIAHIDPMGLMMVVFIGFGFAKPVPTDPRNFNSYYASAWISAAGPLMNLLLAFISVNLLAASYSLDIAYLQQPGPNLFLQAMAFFNMLLMLFNLLPIGPLDGHYILPYFLSKRNAYYYTRWNAQYGSWFLMGFVVLSFMGVPVFSFLANLGVTMAGYLVIL